MTDEFKEWFKEQASRLRKKAVARADEVGHMDARAVAIWDVAAWLSEVGGELDDLARSEREKDLEEKLAKIAGLAEEPPFGFPDIQTYWKRMWEIRRVLRGES